MGPIRILDSCTNCGACVEICAASQVYQLGEDVAQIVNPDDCWLCGHCVAVCPVDAIEHAEYPLDECPPIDKEILPSLEGLVMALRQRRSARVFRDQPVPREVVRELVDLSRWAPSASNEQPVDWVAIDNRERIAALRDKGIQALKDTEDTEYLADQLAQGKDPLFFHAPVVLVAHVPKSAGLGRDDTIYAVYNLMLGAERMGLGTCQIGYFNWAMAQDRDLVKELCLPKGRRLQAMMILGYPRFKFKRALPRRRMEIAWNPT